MNEAKQPTMNFLKVQSSEYGNIFTSF